MAGLTNRSSAGEVDDMKQRMPHGRNDTRRRFATAIGATALIAASPALQASDAALGSQICAVLTMVAPEVQMFDPQAARARFVAAINMKFQEDPIKIREVSANIDRLATASCRKERDELLKITQMLSLSEAFGDGW